jgi:hypothetical protein
MNKAHGFALPELIGIVIILVVLVSVVSVVIFMPREDYRHRTESRHLVMIHKAMYIYSVNNKNRFPSYGAKTPGRKEREANCKGFQVTDRSVDVAGDRREKLLTSGAMTANVTASLFIMVRDGSVSTKNFICPWDEDAEHDPLAQVVARGKGYQIKKPAALIDIYDFGQPESLSYSAINMFDQETGSNWSSNASADWILMGDRNDAESKTREKFFEKHSDWRQGENGLTTTTIRSLGSPNHNHGEFQNLLYGDGHVSGKTGTWHGPANDNVMTRIVDGYEAPPTLSNSAIQDQWKQVDVMLIPVRGNNGVNLANSK